MSKNMINFFATGILAVALSFFLPWWGIMVAAFITAILIPLRKGAVFFAPYFAIFFFWVIHSYILSNANDFVLAKKIAELLPLGGNSFALMLVTGMLGGLAAGISAILGKQIRSLAK